MILPVVARELRVRARLASTRYTRMGAAGMMLVFAAAVLWPLSRQVPGAGVIAFTVMQYVLLLFCLLEGVRLAAGLIAEERREGTLGLLFLTPLRPWDILLGKLSGAVLTAVYALLAMVPVLGLAVLMGGVTGGELARSALALFNALGVALAAGAWASVRARDTAMAMVVALGMLGGVCLVPIALDAGWDWGLRGGWSGTTWRVALVSPVITVPMAQEGLYPASAGRFWLGQAMQPLVAVLLLGMASIRLHRSWRDEGQGDASMTLGSLMGSPAGEAGRGGGRRGEGRSGSRSVGLGRWVAVVVGLNLVAILPNFILARLAVPATGTAGILMVMGIPAALAGLTSTLLVIYLSARALSDAKESGELELLLTTPLGDRGLLDRLWGRLRAFPIALTGVAGVVAMVEIVTVLVDVEGPFAADVVLRAGRIAAAVVGVVAVWYATCAEIHVALWFSLTSRRLMAAVVRTFLLVMVATGLGVAVLQAVLSFGTLTAVGPTRSGFALVLPSALMVLAYSFWLRWARHRLRTRFRGAAAEWSGAQV